MITAILSILGWVAKHFYEVAKWLGPAFARVISNWWVIAGLSIFSIASWALSDWSAVCDGVSAYIDSVTNVLGALELHTGVEWIDGFMGFFALDSFASYLVAFLAFFLPFVATVVIGIFVSMIGFAIKLIVYKITASATRDLGKT